MLRYGGLILFLAWCKRRRDLKTWSWEIKVSLDGSGLSLQPQQPPTCFGGWPRPQRPPFCRCIINEQPIQADYLDFVRNQNLIERMFLTNL